MEIKNFPNVQKAFGYAEDILLGKIVSCHWIKKACLRFQRDLKDTRFYFDYEAAERACKYIQRFPHIKGPLCGTPLTMEPWQLFIMVNAFGFKWAEGENKGFRRFKKIFILVARKQGKALDIETEIPTPTGFVKMKDLKVGDRVFNENGEEVFIECKTDVMELPSYKLTLRNGQEIVSCENHEWPVYDKLARRRSRPRKSILRGKTYPAKKLEYRITDTETLSKNVVIGTEFNYMLPVAGAVSYSKKELPIDPYIMGYWIGNGAKSSSRISTQDRDVVSYFEKFYVAKQESKYDWYISGGLRQSLRKDFNLGYGPTKYIPENYLMSSYEDRMGLLRGLMDSDGGVEDCKGRVGFSQSNPKVFEQVVTLIGSLGIKYSPTDTKQGKYRDKKTGEMILCKDSQRISFNPTFNVFKCKRKFDQLQKCLDRERCYRKHELHTISKVESVGIKKVQCIQVSGNSHLYLCTKSFIPTHNSAISAPVGIYMLSLDREAGPEVYSVASKRDQARLVFDVARAMIDKTPTFVKHTGTEVFRHHIEHEASVGVFKPLSSDSNTSDGLNPHFVILDEVHAFKDRNLYGVMETAIGARKQPMLWAISTAGFDDTGVCHELQVDLEKILNQEFDDPSQFGVIYTLDKGDDFRDKKCWIKANPNLGVSVNETYIQDQVNTAIRNPGNRTNILTKHFNIWCSASENFFDTLKWDSCQGVVDIEKLKGKPCYIAIDLASKIDLTAMVAIFRVDGKYIWLVRAYLPEQAIKDSKNASYEAWAHDKHIIVTPGEVISHQKIQDDLMEWHKMFKIRAVHYDPWNATEMAERMSAKHINMVEFKMTTANLSEPMKKMDAEIRQGNMLHDGNPVTRWNIGNVVSQTDHNQNVFPRKQHEKHKIDIAVAGIMAMAGWATEKQGSVYEKRGLIIL